MSAKCLVTHASSPDGVESLAAAVRAWEPQLELQSAGPLGRLYDPDATQYALLLGPACTLSTDRRHQPIACGDLVVIPPALAIDVDPYASFLVVCYLGTPPYHFRERFLQVWGFEHFLAPVENGGLVLDDPSRGHRLRYETLDRQAELVTSALELKLLVSRSADLTLTPADRNQPTSTGSLALLAPGWTGSVSAPESISSLTLLPELLHARKVSEARQVASQSLSPEYQPPAGPESPEQPGVTRLTPAGPDPRGPL